MDLKKRKTEKNRGFSIVEFLVAFGILSVIVTTVGYMMTTSSKTYSGLSTEAQLQSEAQLVANGISELAIDSFDAGNTAESDYTCQIDDSISLFFFPEQEQNLRDTESNVAIRQIQVIKTNCIYIRRAMIVMQMHIPAQNPRHCLDSILKALM